MHLQYTVGKWFILKETCLPHTTPHPQCGTSQGNLKSLEMIINLPILPRNDNSKWDKELNNEPGFLLFTATSEGDLC